MESIRTLELVQVIAGYLKKIANNTTQGACCQAVTSAGLNTSIPAGFSSASVVLLGGTAVITMSDGSTYTMSTIGEILVQSAPPNKFLPAITITGSGTWKWSAIK